MNGSLSFLDKIFLFILFFVFDLVVMILSCWAFRFWVRVLWHLFFFSYWGVHPFPVRWESIQNFFGEIF